MLLTITPIPRWQRLLTSSVSQFGESTGTVCSGVCNDSTTHRCEFPATPAADGNGWMPCCAHQDRAQVSRHAAPLAALFFHGSHDASLDEPPHAKVNSDNIPRFHGNSGSSASRYGNNSSNDRSPPATASRRCCPHHGKPIGERFGSWHAACCGTPVNYRAPGNWCTDGRASICSE